MSLKPIIDEIEQTILSECCDIKDYASYVENCLLFDPESGAEYYNITVEQFKYCCARALLRL